MPDFHYTALAKDGGVERGAITAASAIAAKEALRARNVAPLEVAAAARPRRAFIRRRKLTERDLMLTTRELAILLHAGAPVDQALAKIGAVTASGPMAGVADDLLVRVSGGETLSGAMAARPEIFPAFYVGIVRAGEAGGALAPALDRIAAMLERSAKLKSALSSALTYPLLVFALTGLSLVVLLVYVVPEFRLMFDEARTDLPLPTRIVLAASDFFVNWGLLALSSALIGGVVLSRYRATSAGRLHFDSALLATPLVGDLLHKVGVARFCRTLGALRANGVALIDGVAISAGVMGNAAAAAAAAGIAAPLAEGRGLAGPMRDSGVFPELALQLIEVGEESGRLDIMLLQVADVYDDEVARATQRLLAMLAPAVTILLGCLIAFVIGAILSAILGAYDLAV